MKRLLPLAGCVVVVFALTLSSWAAPRLLITSFQVSDCRGDDSYRFNPVETDTGSPHVTMGVQDNTPGLNTGNTYPSFSSTWPWPHSTSAPGMVALFRGGSGDGGNNRAPSGTITVNTTYASNGSATGRLSRTYASGKTSGASYPEVLPYTTDRIGGATGLNGQALTLKGACSYANTTYGPTNDSPATAFTRDRGDSRMHIFSHSLPSCGTGIFSIPENCGVAFSTITQTGTEYGNVAGHCGGSCIAFFDNGNTGAAFSNFLASCPSIHDDSGQGDDTFNHSYGCDEYYYENYTCDVPSYVSGRYGDSNGAWGFNATQSQQITGDSSGAPVDTVSLEAWVYADPVSLSGRHAVLGQGAVNSELHIGLYNGKWAFWVGNGSSPTYLTSVANATASTWTHLVGVYEKPGQGHTGTGKASLFVDGLRQLQSGSLYQVDVTWNTNTAAFKIGASSSGDYFSGRVDEAALWNVALTPEEVAALFSPTVFKYTTAGINGILESPAAYQFGPSSLIFYTDADRNAVGAQGTTDTVYMRTSNLPLNYGADNYVQFVAQDTDMATAATLPYQVTVTTKNPDAPSTVTGRGVDNGTVLWAWQQDYACNPHSFNVTRTVNAGTSNVFPGSIIAASLQPYTTGYVQSGLGVNEPAGLQISAKTIYGASPLTETVTAYTLANAPSGLTALKVSLTSMTFVWNINSNPAYTPYDFSYSNNDPAFGTVSVSTPITFDSPYVASSATVTGLLPTTTYYFRTRAANGNGGYPGGGQVTAFNTAIDGVNPVPTLPVAPDPVVASAVSTSAVVWSWPVVPTVQRYEILNSAGDVECNDPQNSFNYGTGYSGCSGNFQNQPPEPNKRLGIRVRTVNLSGASVASPAIFAYTMAMPPTTFLLLGQSSNTVNLSWDGNGNPGGTAYQLAASLDPAFPTTGTSTITVTGVTASFPGLLPGTSYYFHVRAINGDGVPTAVVTLGGNAQTPTPANQSQGVLEASVASSVTASDGRTRIDVPAGALSASATVYVSVDPVNQPVVTDNSRLVRTLGLSPSAGVSYAPATAREFIALVNNKLSSSPFNSPIVLSLPFSDGIHPGVVDDSDPPIQTGSLKAYTLNPYLDLWEPVPSTIDLANRRVRASTTHFSIYALFGQPLAAVVDLSTVKVYPQPWRPGSGGPFDSATKGSAGPGLLFDGLPSDGLVTIYTLLGQKVAALHAQATGTGYAAVWDGKNAAGHKAASAVYIAHIEGAGKKKTVKIGLER